MNFGITNISSQRVQIWLSKRERASEMICSIRKLFAICAFGFVVGLGICLHGLFSIAGMAYADTGFGPIVSEMVTPDLVPQASKVKKPGKPILKSITRNSKTKLTLKWSKSARARGYQVFMKTNGGKFKLVKTTSRTVFAKSGLKVGNTYYFTVRAFAKSGSKNKFSAYSSIRKVKLKPFVNMVGTIKPYSQYGNWGYVEHSGADALEMAGNKYYNSFEVTTNYGEDGYAIYNLNGKYSKVEFVVGNLGSVDHELLIKCDDETVRTITVKGDSIPKKYSVSVKGVYKFELRFNRQHFSEPLGFGNPRLYY